MTVKIKRGTDLTITLFIIGIYLVPYDAMRYLMPSTYAPISIYFFILSYFMTLLREKVIIEPIDKRIVSFGIYAILYTFATSVFFKRAFDLTFKFYYTFILGIIIYLSIRNAFRRIKKYIDNVDLVYFLISRLAVAYLIPVIVGLLELMSKYGILPSEVKTILNTIFGGWQTGRLCITSYEASWASIHMLLAIVLNLYMIKRRKKPIYYFIMLSAVVLFFALLSAQGIIVLCAALIISIFLIPYMNANLYDLFKYAIIFVAIGALVLFGIYKIAETMPTMYFAARILSIFNNQSFYSILVSDGSTFVRIGYLLIHLLIFKDYFISGVGGGGFEQLFSGYIFDYFPRATNLIEVARHIQNGNPNSVISIYFSVFSEFGIVGTLWFSSFIISALRNIRKLYSGGRESKYIVIFISICLMSLLQFGSWCYVPFWLAVGLVASI